jgi:nucleoid DNA-binding protein
MFAGLALFLGVVGIVYPQRPPTNLRPGTQVQAGSGTPLVTRVANRTKLPEVTVKKILDAMGLEVLAEMQRGGAETLPNLGKMRIVRIPEHKDMERGTGRVITAAGRNYVVFDPEGDVASAANIANVVPNEVVPQFEYNVLPGQTPSPKAGRTRVPPIRTPS